MSAQGLSLSADTLQQLSVFAPHVWWKTQQEALRYPDRIIAQVMNRGSYEQVCQLVDTVGEEYLLQVLKNAECGQFNERSWAYWHYRLTDICLGEVPPMPTRKYDADLSATP